MKNMAVLIDTNILLDVILKREPFFTFSNKIFSLCCSNVLSGKIAAHSITNIFYVARKNYTQSQLRTLLLSIFQFFDVISLDKEKLLSALNNSNFKDFEDCLQDECAHSINADYIITRNIRDFEGSKIPAITPEEYLKLAREL